MGFFNRKPASSPPPVSHTLSIDNVPRGVIKGSVAEVSNPYGEYTFNIVGESHNVAALKKVTGGRNDCERRAILIRDRGNPHDANAVMVTMQGRKVGYLSRGDAVAAVELFVRLSEVGVDVIQVEGLVGWNPSKPDVIGVKLAIPDGFFSDRLTITSET